jgi:hypothetical protein
VDDDGGGTRSLGGSEKELVEVHGANKSIVEGEGSHEMKR